MAEFVQDPFWGAWGTNLANSLRGAGKASLDQTMTAEQILALREKRARETDEYNAKIKSGNLIADTLATTTKPQETIREVPGFAQGPSNPADPTTPLGEVFLPPGTVQEKFVDPVTAERYRRELPMYQALSRSGVFSGGGDPYGNYAKGRVALGGVPTDPRDRENLQFQTTGKLMTGAEHSAPTVHAFAVYGPDNQPTGQRVATADNKTEYGTGRPLVGGPNPVVPAGHTMQPTGPADAQQKMTPEAARERLAVFLRTSGGATPTPAQQAQIGQLVDIAYPVTRKFEDLGGDQKGYRNVRETPIPPAIVRLMQPAAPAAAAGADPAAAAAAAPAPLDPNAPQLAEKVPGSAIEMRKEYAALPEIKTYLQAAYTWNAAVQSAYTGNKAADAQIIYGFIKMMDNITGVREGEVKMAGQIGSWPEQMQTLIGQATGKGMDARTRSNIIETMQRYMGQYETAAKNQQAFYGKAAQAAGLAPEAVIPALLPLEVFDRKRALAVKNEVPGQPGATAASDEEKARLRAKLRGGQ